MNQDDNSIPLLTEIIPPASPQVSPPAPTPHPAGQIGLPGAAGPDYGAAAKTGAFHTQPSAATYQAPSACAPAQFPAQPATPVAEQYRQWEQEIRENVLQSLLEQADTVLQQHLQDQIAVVLDNIGDILTQRIKESLRTALAETVSRAVAEEMARFTSSKK